MGAAASATAALSLQRAAGNRAVSALVAGGPAVLRRNAPSAPVQRSAAPDPREQALARIEAILDPETVGEEGGVTGSGSAPSVQASRAGVVQRQDPEAPPPPRPATSGDLMKAIVATEQGKQATEVLKEEAKAVVMALKPGELAGVVTASLAIGGIGVAGAMTDPDARSLVFSQVSGRKVPVPGVQGLSVKVDLAKDGRPTGGMLYFNVGSVLPSALGFE